MQDESGCEADALGGYTFAGMIDWVQQNLFIVQAHIAGADKTIAQEKITHMESAIDAIEKELPPIKTFLFLVEPRLRRNLMWRARLRAGQKAGCCCFGIRRRKNRADNTCIFKSSFLASVCAR